MDLTDNDLLQPTNMESSKDFQKFIFDLFEKNGILTDLRAYLRGHIVTLLKSAQTGITPPCQKLFTERLDLMYQAVNILILEYLLKKEFKYTLSVYVSELPLSNMVFGLAKSIMNGVPMNNGNGKELRFSNEDVLSVIKYLGLQCDSNHVTRLLEMYNNDNSTPLLLCILKCMPLYGSANVYDGEATSEVLTDSSLDTDSETKLLSRDRCKRLQGCKACQKRLARMKNKYRTHIEQLKSLNDRCKCMELNIPLTEVGVIEKNLIDEMFQELKTVYETEMDIIRQNQQDKIKYSLVTYAENLQKKRDELEAAYTMRKSTLEKNIEQKKKFLWGLARSLRQQHAAVSRAMKLVKERSHSLSHKEAKLQNQLKDAEQVLQKRSEEIRTQISNELIALKGYLNDINQEKTTINEERLKIENLEKLTQMCKDLKSKDTIEQDIPQSDKPQDNPTERFKTLNELSNVNDKVESAKSNCDDNDLYSKLKDEVLNNVSEERPSKTSLSNKVNNELKFNKNCNSQYAADETYCNQVHPRNSDDFSVNWEIVHTLQLENKRLKEFADQQRLHIEQLNSAELRLQMELLSAKNAAAVMASIAPKTEPFYVTMQRASLAGSLPNAAGEELNVIEPTVRNLSPHDDIPFITKNDLHNSKPHDVCSSRHKSPATNLDKVKRLRYKPVTAGLLTKTEDCARIIENEEENDEISVKTYPKTSSIPSHHIRHKSPTSVLREAKSRLRKLKIEADAVEQSYMDYRRRHCDNDSIGDRAEIGKKNSSCTVNERDMTCPDIDKRYKNNETRHKNAKTNLKNKNTAIQIVKPIPKQYCLQVGNVSKENFIEKPLNEFRKLYRSPPPKSPVVTRKPSKAPPDLHEENNSLLDEIKQIKSTNDNVVINSEYRSNDANVKSNESHVSEAKSSKNYAADFENIVNYEQIDYNNRPTSYGDTNTMSYVEGTPRNSEIINFNKDVPNIDTPSETSIKENSVKTLKEDNENLVNVTQSDTKEAESDVSVQAEAIRTDMTIIVSPKLEKLRPSSLNDTEKLEVDDELQAIYKNSNEIKKSNVDLEHVGDRDVVNCEFMSGDKYTNQYSDDFSGEMFSQYESTYSVRESRQKKSDDESFWDS